MDNTIETKVTTPRPNREGLGGESSLDIKAYLDADEKKDLLRLLTAGSVDDGKSTLIGRLLFDSKKLYEDQLQALERDSKRVGNAGAGQIDYALLLDGLKAEREEGITIDVAYRYFSTNQRKFIIADTPGHEQYTRNMITGGSTANLAIILVDARTGVITQTRRHTFLVSLLGIKHIVLAVNKMDLVDFSEEVFTKIKNEYLALTNQLGIEDVTCFPLSALEGDNVVEKSERTPWYKGISLLQFLETVPIDRDRNMDDFRFPVQYVLRPNLNFRGFCGKVASGVIRKGDEVMALPSMKKSKVKSIVTYEGELDYAFCPQSICITLEDEIDISRGEMIVRPDNVPNIGRYFQTMLVWMDEEPMDRGKQFFLKHNTNTTRATIDEVCYRVDVNTMEQLPGTDFKLNEIGCVRITTAKTLFFDVYKQNKATGAFILIDPITNNTSAVGMIIRSLEMDDINKADVPTLDLKKLEIGEEHYEAIEKAVKELARQGLEIIIRR
ncbi:MAG: sulfate adenylyltransferase subunit CysN [Bacteroidaceae bacterium]|nr:sulfate adenylyltransferase subunit CysN [Bacteroidaceae bacterium]